MSKLYACIISTDAKRDKETLVSVARQFSYSIEMLDDGLLFDASGLERLIGKPSLIAQKIVEQLQKNNISGSVAVAEKVDTAELLARQKKGVENAVNSPNAFQQLPLQGLQIEQDTLNVLNELGIKNIDQMLDIPRQELISRYGRGFQDVIDVIEQKGSSLLTPNVKDDQVSWAYQLDFPVEDFEQLIFLLNHGLDKLFAEVGRYGFSTDHLDISVKLNNKAAKAYEIKTSFPTLDKAFWLKLSNLRISMDPPESEIVAVNVVSHFTKPRPSQRGLYAVSRPEPESLLLTINKLKKLVGEDNVGVPILLDQRLPEAFGLDAGKLPQGKEKLETHVESTIIAFSYFHPPLRTEVLVRDSRLIFIRTDHFSGHVTEYSGVWKTNSRWWDRSWKTHEWDVEVENNGVYRLCKVDKEWFLAGEYD